MGDTFFVPYERAKIAHLIQGGGKGGEIRDLREDLERAFGRVGSAFDALNEKAPVRLCTAAALNLYTVAGSGDGKTLTQSVAAVENIDGVAPVVGNRVLVNNAGTATAADRGIYTVTTVGTVAVRQVLTRATDADDNADVTSGMGVRVLAGSTLAGHHFYLSTANPIVVDTDGLSFTEDDPGFHASRHIFGGLDVVDGDRLVITWTPTTFTRTLDIGGLAGDLTALTAHLNGIDLYAAGLTSSIALINATLAARDRKESARLCTAAALGLYTASGGPGLGRTLTQNGAGVQEDIDGTAVVVGDRILVNDTGTATAADRGIYTVDTVGAPGVPQVLVRATDADDDVEVTSGMFLRVTEGATLADTVWHLTTNDPIVVDTDGLSFSSLPNAHAATHTVGSTDVVDGDEVDITWTPTTFTRTVDVGGLASGLTSLTAHLNGIDLYAGSLASSIALINATLAARDRKESARLCTAAALNAYTASGGPGLGHTLTQDGAGAQEDIDGTAVVAGDRILVNDTGTVTATDRGIYTVTVAGAFGIPQVLVRATDADDDVEVTAGMFLRVTEGATLADTVWCLTTDDPIVVDTTPLSFSNLPNAHAGTHTVGSTDVVDGDEVEITWTPANSTPTVDLGGLASGVTSLTAHLNGVDLQLGLQAADILTNAAGIAALNAHSAFPEIWGVRPDVAPTLAVDGSANFRLIGAAFLQGQSFSHLAIGGLDIIAEEPGVGGDSISVEVVDTGIGGLAITYVGGTLSIDQGGSGSNEDAVAVAINVGAALWTGVLRANSLGGGAVPVTALTPLAGGLGTGLSVYCGGVLGAPTGEAGGLALSTASYTDTLLLVNPASMAGDLAANDTATIRVVSNDMTSLPVTVLLA